MRDAFRNQRSLAIGEVLTIVVEQDGMAYATFDVTDQLTESEDYYREITLTQARHEYEVYVTLDGQRFVTDTDCTFTLINQVVAPVSDVHVI